MYICYIDESGTSDIPGNTSHFILAGISIPVWHWRGCDREIEKIKNNYGLGGSEIHVGWMLRPYTEQIKIDGFELLHYPQRRSKVLHQRKIDILQIQRKNKPLLLKQTKKNYRKTDAYIHLTYNERRSLVYDMAKCVSNWGFSRLFAECIDKIYFDPSIGTHSVDEQAFEQLVSRFEQYLQNISREGPQYLGILVHDNNFTVEKRHTELMKSFHKKGTLWTQINNIIETPLFVDSQLTSMVQIADLCAYSLRRYLENGEDEFFNLIFQRADRIDTTVVGVRHYTKKTCQCSICAVHRLTAP